MEPQRSGPGLRQPREHQRLPVKDEGLSCNQSELAGTLSRGVIDEDTQQYRIDTTQYLERVQLECQQIKERQIQRQSRLSRAEANDDLSDDIRMDLIF